MGSPVSLVFLVDDDRPTRIAVERLLQLDGFEVETFESARGFLAREASSVPSCLLLDVQMPGMSGLQLQSILRGSNNPELPIVFITAYGDVKTTVRAVKNGAEDVIEKPFESEELFDAVRRALERDRRTRADRSVLAEFHRRFDSLTPREQEVFRWVAAGIPNKRIASELGTAEKTIKKHRGRVMLKMQAESLADLVRMADKLMLPLERPPRDAEHPHSYSERVGPLALDPAATHR